MNKTKTKASALLFVLVMMFVVTLLANVVLQIMLNQSRLSRHGIWRVQALYAAQAAMVLTMQQLRDGSWGYGRTACINCEEGVDYIVQDNDISYTVNIEIGDINDSPVINPAAPAFSGCAPIEITVNYQHAGTF